MWTKHFWKDAMERAIKTTAQTAAGLMTADGLGIVDVDWCGVGSVSGLAFVLSILTSIGSAPIGANGSPSILK